MNPSMQGMPPAINPWRAPGLAMAIVVSLLLAGMKWFESANSDLIELTPVRLSDLASIRPAVLKFRADKGSYPQQLPELVPEYLPAVPVSLVNRAGMESVQQLHYRARGETANANFHRHRGPDSSVEYDFVTGRVKHDQ